MMALRPGEGGETFFPELDLKALLQDPQTLLRVLMLLAGCASQGLCGMKPSFVLQSEETY